MSTLVRLSNVECRMGAHSEYRTRYSVRLVGSLIFTTFQPLLVYLMSNFEPSEGRTRYSLIMARLVDFSTLKLVGLFNIEFFM